MTDTKVDYPVTPPRMIHLEQTTPEVEPKKNQPARQHCGTANGFAQATIEVATKSKFSKA